MQENNHLYLIASEAYNDYDYDKAFKIFETLARHENEEAQCTIGLMYENGQGTKQNHVYAYMWYIIAEKNGDKAVKLLKNELEKKLNAKQKEEAKKLADECLASNYKDCKGCCKAPE